MNIQDIREIAADNGIKPGKMNKVGLVREIQRTEGNFDCFATTYDGVCDQYGCMWRDDCFAASKQLVS